ncbi:MAG: hypothetical protein ACLQU1_10980 [Bryobacteraceae bacterium]
MEAGILGWQRVAKEPVKSMILVIVSPFEHKTLFIPLTVRPSVEVLVMYIAVYPVVKPAPHFSFPVVSQPLKYCTGIDAGILRAFQKSDRTPLRRLSPIEQMNREGSHVRRSASTLPTLAKTKDKSQARLGAVLAAGMFG